VHFIAAFYIIAVVSAYRFVSLSVGNTHTHTHTHNVLVITAGRTFRHCLIVQCVYEVYIVWAARTVVLPRETIEYIAAN